MPSEHVAMQDRAPVTGVRAEIAAEMYDVLGAVHEVLRQRRIPCLRVALVSLELWGARPPASPEHRMPVLEVWAQGRVVAVITVGTHTHDFHVTVPGRRAGPHVVPAGRPERVLELIPGYGRAAP
jgi:hypothetical protein